MLRRVARRVGPLSAGAGLLTLAFFATARAQQVPAPPFPALQADEQPQGVEVLTRGPLHEAFAEPVVFDPKPGPLVPKPPPAPVEEAPPDQKPEGANVQWVPGYWAWDDGRNDFLWISGLWRDVPPGRQWVPGYWTQEPGGFRWVAGAWVPVAENAAQGVEYLPVPPASLEAGPSSPAPVAGAVWLPGYWVWQADRYAWRPGFWMAYQADWVWVPAHYVWTPGGYLFVDGYWDRTIGRRGVPFAPVYFAQPVYQRPQFVYTPTISLVATALVTSLFVRPTCHQYYFGDYYAANNARGGIYPAYSFHQSRFGYDPVFAHAAAVNLRRDPRWLDNVHDDYRYRRDHPEARPPHTYAKLRQVVNQTYVTNITNVTNVNQKSVTINRNLVLARPLAQVAANPSQSAPQNFGGPDPAPIRFTKLDADRRREFARQGEQLRAFREQRLKQEAAVPTREARPNPVPGPIPDGPGPDRPRRVNLSRSPIAAGAVAAGRSPNLPARPQMPPVDLKARPRPDAPQLRPEPQPDQRPRPFPGTGRDANRETDAQRQKQAAMKAQQQKQLQEARKSRPLQDRQLEMMKAKQEQERERQRLDAAKAKAEQVRERLKNQPKPEPSKPQPKGDAAKRER